MHSSAGRAVELGRKGGLASIAARMEREEHARQRMRRRVAKDFDAIYGRLSRGARCRRSARRVRAATAMLAEAYGAPATAIVGDDNP